MPENCGPRNTEGYFPPAPGSSFAGRQPWFARLALRNYWVCILHWLALSISCDTLADVRQALVQLARAERWPTTGEVGA